MCEPITAALGIGAAASAAGGTAAAASTALATTKLAISGISAAASIGSSVMGTLSQNAAAEQNNRSAIDAYIVKSAAQNTRIRQEGQAAFQKKEDARLKALRSQGTARAAAGSGGVQGKSVEGLMNEYSRSEAVFRDRTAQQLEANTDAIRFDMEGYRAEADARSNSMQGAGIGNIFGAVVGAGATLLTGYEDYTTSISGKD